jgi:D-aminopeptidase
MGLEVFISADLEGVCEGVHGNKITSAVRGYEHVYVLRYRKRFQH